MPVAFVNALWHVISRPWSQVSDRRSGSGILSSFLLKATSADAAVASGMRHSNTKRLLRSSSTPTALLLAVPLMRSASQWPGTMRSSTSGGRILMLDMSAIARRFLPHVRGLRLLLPWRSNAIKSLLSSPAGCA